MLTALMKTGLLIGFTDPYYFVLAVNVIQVTAVLISIFYITGKIGGASPALQWFAALVFSMWTPVWACTNSFYSDQLSFGGSMIAIAILLRCRDMSGYKKYLLYLLSGFLWGLAIVVKATAGIPLVAFIITVILTAKNKKRSIGKAFPWYW